MSKEDLRPLLVTAEEANWILDSFKASAAWSRPLALKAAGLVLEFAGREGVEEAKQALAQARAEKIAENARKLGL